MTDTRNWEEGWRDYKGRGVLQHEIEYIRQNFVPKEELREIATDVTRNYVSKEGDTPSTIMSRFLDRLSDQPSV